MMSNDQRSHIRPGNGRKRGRFPASAFLVGLAVSLTALVTTMEPALAQAKQQGKSAARAPTEQGLQRRVEQLEEQLVDMQVVIGTLESLAKGGGGGGSQMPATAGGAQQGAYSSSDAARIDSMETQIRALTAQIEQMAQQLRDGRRGDAGGAAGPSVAGAPPVRGTFGSQLAPPPGTFGSTTVIAGPQNGADGASDRPGGQRDAIGNLLAGNAPQPGVERQTLPPAVAGGDRATPKQLYETAYGYLLQQDYGAAEAAFTDFLQRFPKDTLASNAQYWLGESYFVRGQYKEAASAFLAGVRTYGRGAKAADSMLKLAMSLDRLGQREAACSSYAELSSRFPNAPNHVRSRASAERQRIGCA